MDYNESESSESESLFSSDSEDNKPVPPSSSSSSSSVERFEITLTLKINTAKNPPKGAISELYHQRVSTRRRWRKSDATVDTVGPLVAALQPKVVSSSAVPDVK